MCGFEFPSCFARDRNLNLPAETNSSIFSLKGWRWSSDESAHTFCTFFSQAVREETIDRREAYSKLWNYTYWFNIPVYLLKSDKEEQKREGRRRRRSKSLFKEWTCSVLHFTVFVLPPSFISIQTWACWGSLHGEMWLAPISGRKPNNSRFKIATSNCGSHFLSPSHSTYGGRVLHVLRSSNTWVPFHVTLPNTDVSILHMWARQMCQPRDFPCGAKWPASRQWVGSGRNLPHFLPTVYRLGLRYAQRRLANYPWHSPRSLRVINGCNKYLHLLMTA